MSSLNQEQAEDNKPDSRQIFYEQIKSGTIFLANSAGTFSLFPV